MLRRRRRRALLYAVSADDMTEHDREQAPDGVHALVWEGEELIGHVSVIQRRLLHGGRCAPSMSRTWACARTGGGVATVAP